MSASIGRGGGHGGHGGGGHHGGGGRSWGGHGGERGGRSWGGHHGHGERGERSHHNWGWGGWGWPYAWGGGWGGWGWPYGYGLLDLPAGRVLDGNYVLLGQEAPALDAGPVAPVAALVDAPAPTRANRDILPMSTGVPILPTQSAQITGRPQTVVFSINRFLISNAGTAGGAADWIVNDIKIGNRSQFVQSGDVPGDLFATNAIDTFVRFDTAQTAMDVVVVVTYIGLNECGAPFFGAMVGTAAV